MERFSRDHQWIRVDGDVGTVGVTDYAQSQLSDVVSVELAEAGSRAAAGETVAVVESVEAASDVFTPVAGEVVEVDDELAGQLALVNTDAEGEAWFFKIKLGNAAELGALMDRTAYQAFIKDSVRFAIYRAARTTAAQSDKRLQRRLDLPNASNELELFRARLHLCHVHVELQ